MGSGKSGYSRYRYEITTILYQHGVCCQMVKETCYWEEGASYVPFRQLLTLTTWSRAPCGHLQNDHAAASTLGSEVRGIVIVML